jgi:hypothetical protein
MKTIASVEVLQIEDTLADEYSDQYKIIMTVPVETPFGTQEIKVCDTITYSIKLKTSSGQRARFLKVIKEGTRECLSLFKASITHKN